MRAGLKPKPVSDRGTGRVERLAGAAKKAMMAGRVLEAQQHYRAILDVEPGHVEASYQLGRAALETRSCAREAIPFLFTALKAAPSEERHWLAAIAALTVSGQVEQARALLERYAGFTFTKLASRGTRSKLAEMLRRRRQQRADEGRALEAETLEDLALWTELDAAEASTSPAKAAPGGASPGIHIHLAAVAPTFMDVRTSLPLANMARSFRTTTSCSMGGIDLPNGLDESERVLVIQRPRIGDPGSWLAAIDQIKHLGWVVVLEIDDHPEFIAATSNQAFLQHYWLPFVAVDAIQTSTPELAQAFERLNPEVACFPNAAFDLPAFREPRADEEIRVFFGALNREQFSAQVGAALAREPGLRQLRYVVVRDTAFRDALGPDAHVEFHPTCPYDRYLELMAGCDICLLPLEGTPGELFKSDLKFVEASSRSLVSLASPAVYAKTIREGETGCLVDRVEDWPDKLLRLVADRDMRGRLARSAWTYVRTERQFEQQAKTRLDWYRSLRSRRGDLDAQMRSRVDAFMATLS